MFVVYSDVALVYMFGCEKESWANATINQVRGEDEVTQKQMFGKELFQVEQGV